jgi:hypothetical protein
MLFICNVFCIWKIFVARCCEGVWPLNQRRQIMTRRKWAMMSMLMAFAIVTVSGLVLMSGNDASAASDAIVYNYTIKYVCGMQPEPINPKFPVAAGFYATDINIMNPYPKDEVEIEKLVSILFYNDEPVGREPRTVKPKGKDSVLLNPVHATMDDCYRIREILDLDPVSRELLVGFFQVRSRIPLEIDAVYTTEVEQQTSTSIEVERIQPMRIEI